MKTDLFADKEFNRKLTKLTLPIAFQSLMLASVAACDALMLGRVSQNAMAAVSLATQVQFVQNMFLGAVTGTVGILGAQYWGKGDKNTIQKIFWISLRLACIVSVLFCCGCVFCPRALMRLFAGDPALVEIGADYLKIAGWSYLITGVSQCLLAVMKVTGHAARSAWVSSGAVVLNAGLNAVFIFGLFGCPAMGANGAALATLFARVAELLWAAGSSLQKGFFRPRLSMFFARDKALTRDYAKIGFPLLGSYAFWGVGFTSYTAVMGQMGADAAAANAVAAVVRDLLCCLCNGVCTGGGILLGNELGAGRLDTGRRYGERLSKLSVLIGLGVMVFILALTLPVTRFVKLSDTARAYLIEMMLILSVYMVGRSVNTVVINGVFSAGGDTLFDVYSLAVCMWGVAVPLAFLGAFVFHWPVAVVYACTCVDEVGKLPWVYAHYRKYKWVKDLTRDAAPDGAQGFGNRT